MSSVRRFDDALARTRGVIGREPSPGEIASLDFARAAPRLIHTVGIRRPLRVVWCDGDEVSADRTLRPWTGVGIYRADRVLETHPATDGDVLYDEVSSHD